MYISDLSIRRPVFATMAIVTLVVLGIIALRFLPMEMFPDVSFPLAGAGPLDRRFGRAAVGRDPPPRGGPRQAVSGADPRRRRSGDRRRADARDPGPPGSGAA